MDDFPIDIPDPLPVRISPCPILEAIMEVRFVTEEDWEVLPGLLFNLVRERYPVKKTLSLSQIPSDIRKKVPELTYRALLQFERENFVIRFGPRVFALATKGDYPGWPAFRSEMEWLLKRVEEAGFITEGERLGLRYMDFFEGRGRLFDLLTAKVFFGDYPVSGPELQVSKVLRREPFQARLVLNDGVTVRRGGAVVQGGLLDLDVWLSAQHFGLFNDGLEQFDKGHDLNKQVFFGLLDPSYLESLKPEYQ